MLGSLFVHMPLRILVVEDHAQFRRVICTALEQRADFRTTEAADGVTAVESAVALQPDLILLDINLPKMHGFEVAKQIRERCPDLPVLFLSQESSPERRTKGAQSRCARLRPQGICRD